MRIGRYITVVVAIFLKNWIHTMTSFWLIFNSFAKRVLFSSFWFCLIFVCLSISLMLFFSFFGSVFRKYIMISLSLPRFFLFLNCIWLCTPVVWLETQSRFHESKQWTRDNVHECLNWVFIFQAPKRKPPERQDLNERTLDLSLG